MKFATKTIHAGQPSEPETGALVAPIFQTSTYEQEAPGHDKGFSYSRTNNPTRQRLEAVLAALEGVEYAAAFASGLAAENAVLQAYLRPGDEVDHSARRVRRHLPHSEQGLSAHRRGREADRHGRSGGG